MRILIVTPSAFPELTGNAVTTERWRRSLIREGLSVAVLPVKAAVSSALEDMVQSFRPELIHVYHAFKAGIPVLEHLAQSGRAALPLVVSPGGTDINLDWGDPGKRECVVQVLRMARVIVAQSSGIIQKLKQQVPELTGKIIDVPKACSWFGDEDYDLRGIADCGPEAVVFFHPAGIRPVKGNLECLRAMERIHELRPQVRFVAAGPAIDSEYSENFRKEMGWRISFARWIPAIPPAAMHAAYRSSDIVLNTSYSEGLSNSLLEAVAAGRPFLASDIPGNRQPVLAGEWAAQAGLYFQSGNFEDFFQAASRFIDDADLRRSLREAAVSRSHKLPTPVQEAGGLIEAYRLALRGHG